MNDFGGKESLYLQGDGQAVWLAYCEKKKQLEGLESLLQDKDAEIKRLRVLISDMAFHAFGSCNFPDQGPCGNCEACQFTADVRKRVAEVQKGGDDE